MIPKENFEQVYPLAQTLADNGYELAISGGSPLQDLIEHCNVGGIHANGGSFEEVEPESVIAHLVKEASYCREDGVSEHGLVMTNAVELAAKAVTDSQLYARTVVVPQINRVLDAADETIRGVMSRRRDPYNIVPVATPSILNNSSLAEMVGRYSNVVIEDIPSIKVADYSPEYILEMLQTGSAGLDQEIENLLSQETGGDWYVTLFVEFLAGKCGFGAIPDHAHPALHLLTRALYDNPSEAVVIGLSDYNLYISKLMAMSGRKTGWLIDTTGETLRLKKLYASSLAKPRNGSLDGNIYVNAGVYAALLSEGLTPELVYANEYRGRRYNPSELLQNKDALLEEYSIQRTINERSVKLEEFNIIKTELHTLLHSEIMSGENVNEAVGRETYIKLLDESMKSVGVASIENLSGLVRDLVCAIFHRHTDVLEYLKLIDEIGSTMDNPDVREVGLLATIEYVSIWVSRMLLFK